MEKVAPEIYNNINNEVYKTRWRHMVETRPHFTSLKTSINPWRVGYSTGIIKKLGIEPRGKTALEVGSGGGILTEEICKIGFTTTGIDPADQSIETASNHAKASGLTIKYDKGTGEHLPYADNSFDCVFCCDVLEHVQDLPKVISEISRVSEARRCFFL
jgi:2-polyprenyl-6-hydroxyphenyl methylase/3-demethylubiquinone-9 3-methyltransferase